jgi:hypothetical protein
LDPKGQGDGLMSSAFTGNQIGFGLILTDEQIAQVNALQNGNYYVSKEEAEFLTEASKKPALMRRMFYDDMVDPPFSKLFQYGQSHNRYWTHWHMKLGSLKMWLTDCRSVFLVMIFSAYSIKAMDRQRSEMKV